MGYTTPRASDVYRYVFRLDGTSREALVDGFSWSILFLNDSSPTSAAFLRRYGAEMCYHTADRIRFVFFSGLSETETPFSREQGILSRIIHATLRAMPRGRLYDWERDPWGDLRPGLFHPLDSAEQIRRNISYECETHSAIPGSEEALRLAHRLGIGRFVPCFLLFSDSGTLKVCLFPVAHRSPDQVFHRLRAWVDSFYEINRGTLSQWADHEKSISDACKRFDASVSAVQNWQYERKRQWRALELMTNHLARVAEGPPASSLIEAITKEWDIPGKIHKMVQPFLVQVRCIERAEETNRKLAAWIAELRECSDPLLIYRRMCAWTDPAELPERVQILLKTAVQLFNPASLIRPEAQLREWWRSEHGRPPSRNRYEKHRVAWKPYSKAKYGQRAKGNVARIIQQEFAVVLRAVFSQSVSQDPKQSGRSVIQDLSTHFGIKDEDSEWSSQTEPYHKSLIDYFINLRKHAPPWLLEIAARTSPPLNWGDCVPSVEMRKTFTLAESLEHLARLADLIRTSTIAAAQSAQRQEQAQAIRNLVACVDNCISSATLIENDRQSIWQSLLLCLSKARQDLEEGTLASARTASTAPFPGKKPSLNDVAHLLKLLDEYDSVRRSLVLPFENDHEVMNVTLGETLVGAAEIGPPGESTSPAIRLRRQLTSAAERAEKSSSEWQQITSEARGWTPAHKLCASIKRTLKRTRILEISSGSGGLDLEAKIQSLMDQNLTNEFLDLLSVQELLALENDLAPKKKQEDASPATTKEQLHESILLLIGVLPPSSRGLLCGSKSETRQKLDQLPDKIERSIFDVFLAHNSHDTPTVLRLGDVLRLHGIQPWIDIEQVPPGRWFQDVVQSALRTVRAAAILFGPSGVGRWQTVELRAFVSRCVETGIPIIPVLLPGVSAVPEDLVFLRQLHQVQFKHDIGERQALSDLVWGITGEKPESISPQ